MEGLYPRLHQQNAQEVFEVLAEAKSLDELQRIEPKAREVRRSTLDSELTQLLAVEVAFGDIGRCNLVAQVDKWCISQ